MVLWSQKEKAKTGIRRKVFAFINWNPHRSSEQFTVNPMQRHLGWASSVCRPIFDLLNLACRLLVANNNDIKLVTWVERRKKRGGDSWEKFSPGGHFSMETFCLWKRQLGKSNKTLFEEAGSRWLQTKLPPLAGIDWLGKQAGKWGQEAKGAACQQLNWAVFFLLLFNLEVEKKPTVTQVSQVSRGRWLGQGSVWISFLLLQTGYLKSVRNGICGLTW